MLPPEAPGGKGDAYMYNVYNQPPQDPQTDSVREGLDAMVSRFGFSRTLSCLSISKTRYTRLRTFGIRDAKDIPVLRGLYAFGVWPRSDEYTAWCTSARNRHLVFSFSWLDENTYPVPGETVVVEGEEYFWPDIYSPQRGTFEKWKAAIEHDIAFAPEALLALAEVFYGLIVRTAQAKKRAWYESYCLPAVHLWGPDLIGLRNTLVMASSILPVRTSLNPMPWSFLGSAGCGLCSWEIVHPRFKVWEPYLYVNDARYDGHYARRSDYFLQIPIPPFVFAQDGVGHRLWGMTHFSPNLSPKMIGLQSATLRHLANHHSAVLTFGSRPYLELFERDKDFLWGDAARIIDIKVPLWKSGLCVDSYLENYGHAAFVLAAYLNKEEPRPFSAATPQEMGDRGWERTNWKRYNFARLFWALCVAKDAGVIDFSEDYIQSAVAEAFAQWQKEAIYQWRKWGRENYDVYINYTTRGRRKPSRTPKGLRGSLTAPE